MRKGPPLRAALVRALLLVLLVWCHGALGAQTDEDEDENGVEWFVFPFPIHSPEPGWALTLSALVSASIRDGPTSSVIATAAWSEHDQRSVAVDTALNIGAPWRLAGRLALADWLTQYFGLGGDTRTDDEEFFDARNFELALDLQREVAPGVWFGPRLDYREHRMDEIAAGGLLEAQRPLGGTVGGAGLRYQALRGQRMNLRLDVGVAEDETGVYFSILEAF